MKRIFLIAIWLVAVPCLAYAELAALEPFQKGDRVLILAPHPDDETIGCAGVIQHALKSGAEVRVVYLTNGDHNQVSFIVYEKRLTLRTGEFIHMGEVRRKEAIQAMASLGLGEDKLIFLGYPDFGTFTIFNRFWGQTRPFRSLLTRISAVPYKENFSFGAPYKGESILNDLKKILLEYKPTRVFVSHPADTNADHKSFYLFLQVALNELEGQIPSPKVHPYLIHCVGWPQPRHYHPELSLEPPAKFSDIGIGWTGLALSREELEAKYKAILCYKSQTQSSAFYLLSFARRNELFGDYPDIDLSGKEAKPQPSFASFSLFADRDIAEDLGLPSKTRLQGDGQVGYAVSGDELLVRIEKNKEMNERFGIQAYLFGYKKGVPFEQMPKLRIVTKHDRCKVFDARRMLKEHGVTVETGKEEFIVRVPLALLGDPDFILAMLKAHARVLVFRTSGFRRIRIN